MKEFADIYITEHHRVDWRGADNDIHVIGIIVQTEWSVAAAVGPSEFSGFVHVHIRYPSGHAASGSAHINEPIDADDPEFMNEPPAYDTYKEAVEAAFNEAAGGLWDGPNSPADYRVFREAMQNTAIPWEERIESIGGLLVRDAEPGTRVEID